MAKFTVCVPGLLTTVQDRGRMGYAASGFSPSGVMDRRAFSLGNLLVGNAANAPAIEFAFAGPTLEFENDAVVAITGADFNPRLDEERAPMYQAFVVRAGQRLSMPAAERGVYGYLALVCYSNGDARGYFNMLTGEIAIKPQYKHAWVFSDGLASVDDNGMIKFIDSKGNVVIDLNIPYITGAEGYVFHNGHCVIHNNKRDKFGLIDKKGNWMLKAEYDAISPKDSFFVVSKAGMQSVLTENLKSILPFMEADLWISGNSITATMKDHTLRKYNLQGELIDDFLISNVDRLLYDTDEIRYTTAKNYDDEGNLTGETAEAEPTPYQKTASCKKYEAELGWYGLISPNGKVITPPRYCDITAIGYDLYLCKTDDIRGEVLNGKGVRVR